jgi:hypothetical protein
MNARKNGVGQERMREGNRAGTGRRKRRQPSANASPSDIPRGIEVLVKKASVDPEFRELLIEKRAEAAGEIDLRLDPAERTILANVPKDQLQAIISRTKVSWKDRAIFLGRAAAVMLTALSTIAIPTGCATKGNDTDRDYLAKKELEVPADDESGPDSGS